MGGGVGIFLFPVVVVEVLLRKKVSQILAILRRWREGLKTWQKVQAKWLSDGFWVS